MATSNRKGAVTGHGAIHFEAVLERAVGPVGMLHIIRFPYAVEDLFGTRGHVHMVGTLNGAPVERALIPEGDGTHYLIVNESMRRKARIREGSMVTVELERRENLEEPEIPEELDAALDLDAAARARYARQTLSTRRAIVTWVGSAKRPETREQRAAEILRRLQSEEFVFGGQRGK